MDIPGATNFLTSEAYKAQQEAKLFSNQESLGRDAFLTLFTTQLKNQNPLDPLENEAFVAQLAQFSSLEAMKGMQGSLEDVSSNLRNEQFLVGASLLGKSVSLESGLVTAGEGKNARGFAQLNDGVDSLIFSVYDTEGGGLVYRREMGSQTAGRVPLSWDGRDNSGADVKIGRYMFAATAVVGEKLAPVSVQSSAEVTAVNWNSQTQNIDFEVDGDTVVRLDQLTRLED